jgi:hypothetical protein
MNRAIAPSFSTGVPIAKAGVDLALEDLCGKLRRPSVAGRWDRRPVCSRIVGNEDVNDTERLSRHPAFRLIGSVKTWDREAAYRHTGNRVEGVDHPANSGRQGRRPERCLWNAPKRREFPILDSPERARFALGLAKRRLRFKHCASEIKTRGL